MLLPSLCVCQGVPPKNSSILINALLIHHYKRGAYYPKGGASEIAFHIIRTIQKYGGNCLVRAPVSQILVDEKGAAHGEEKLCPSAEGSMLDSRLKKLPFYGRCEGEEGPGGSGGSRPCGRIKLRHLHHLPEASSP